MAIRKIAAAVLASFLLTSTPALANQCITIDNFHAVFESNGVKSYGSRASATLKIEAAVNQNRIKMGKGKIEASIVLVAYGKNNKGEIVVVVAIVDEKGCIIEDTITNLPADTWIGFLESSGVKLEDFIPIEGS